MCCGWGTFEIVICVALKARSKHSADGDETCSHVCT